jgi:DNA-binding transcriptional LysR family regulator
MLSQPARFDPKKSAKTFRVAATDYVNFVLLPALLARLQSHGPSISIDVCDLDRVRPLDALLADEVDLVLGSVSATNTYIHRADLFSDDYVCIARKGHPTIKKRLTLAQFVNCSHVVIRQQNGGMGGILDEILQQQGKQRSISISLPQFFAAPHIVMKTDSLMTVTQRIGSALQEVYPLRVFKHPVGLRPFTIAQLWHQRTHTDPTYQWFRKTIFEVVRRMGTGGRVSA